VRIVHGGASLNRLNFGAVGTITLLVELWVDEQKLPKYMRVVPKAK
jgi:hypothetical protein